MNPSYIAYNKALLATVMNTLMGIEPPAPKGKQLNQTDGKLFASKNGNGEEINNSLQDKMEKEANVQAHLDNLAKESKQRYLNECAKYPTIEEIAADRHRSAQGYINRQLAATEDKYPRSDMVEEAEEAQAKHEAHKAYIDRRIERNAQETRERVAGATIHTGETMNLEEHNANNGVPWHQQG